MRPDIPSSLAARLVRAASRFQWHGTRLVVPFVAAFLTMAPTTTETIQPLAAIGRLDFAGYEDRFHCTAALIGADRAVTAAHCMDPPATVANAYFKPGFAISEGIETLGLRYWRAANGASDVAVLCLSPVAGTPPLPRAIRGVHEGEGLNVVGYAIPAERGQRHDSCTVDAVNGDGSFVLNCPLRPGQSGAPVLRHTRNGREIVGIVSATSNSQALAWDVSDTVTLPACD
ncbi:MAG: trypsin-like peptidase domain-containing protein [Alphaproteobacteria bacterium]|jgi:protease YdgD